MDMECKNEDELKSIKQRLTVQLSEVYKLRDILSNRCNLLKQFLGIIEMKIQFDDKHQFKENEVRSLKNLIKTLSESLTSTTKTEIELGLRGRELDKVNHEMSILKKVHIQDKQRIIFLEGEVCRLKTSLEIMQDLDRKSLNVTIQEKEKSSSLNKRLDTLEKNMVLLKGSDTGIKSSDFNQKVKNSLNALMYLNQELRTKDRDNKDIINRMKNERDKFRAKFCRLRTKLQDMKQKV